MTEDYVITGGPCSGKTTLIKALEAKGFAIVPEAARELIEEQMKSGGVFPWTDNLVFQHLVVARQLMRENRGESKRFLDRSCIDSIAYARFWKTALPDQLLMLIKSRAYAGVFLLEPVSYANDDVRLESEEEGRQITQLLKEAYLEAGYTPIVIPALPIEQRVALVIQHAKGR